MQEAMAHNMCPSMVRRLVPMQLRRCAEIELLELVEYERPKITVIVRDRGLPRAATVQTVRYYYRVHRNLLLLLRQLGS